MGRILVDPPYLVALGALFCVISVSLAFAGGSSGASTPASLKPAAASTPSPAQVLLDSRRALDLAADSAALEAYRARHGAYPSSEGNFMTFCNLAYDPGCQVLSVTTKISASDGTYPYWYRSDGKTFTLFARAETPPAGNRCPPESPPQLAGLPLFCVSAPGGTR